MKYETVAEVLRAIGWPLGTGGRTTCPVHHGDNQTAFSYRENVWTCFAGCGAGGVKALLERLGLTDPEPPPPRQVLGMHFDPIRIARPKVSSRLEAAFKQQVRLRRQEVEEKHSWSLKLLRDIDQGLDDVRCAARNYADSVFPEQLEERWQKLGAAWVETMQQLRHAHAEMIVLAWASRLDPELRFDPCPGECYSGGDDPRDKLTPDLFVEVQGWVDRQDAPFREMVTKFLEG
jgi:hypothetical protein